MSIVEPFGAPDEQPDFEGIVDAISFAERIRESLTRDILAAAERSIESAIAIAAEVETALTSPIAQGLAEAGAVAGGLDRTLQNRIVSDVGASREDAIRIENAVQATSPPALERILAQPDVVSPLPTSEFPSPGTRAPAEDIRPTPPRPGGEIIPEEPAPEPEPPFQPGIPLPPLEPPTPPGGPEPPIAVPPTTPPVGPPTGPPGPAPPGGPPLPPGPAPPTPTPPTPGPTVPPGGPPTPGGPGGGLPPPPPTPGSVQRPDLVDLKQLCDLPGYTTEAIDRQVGHQQTGPDVLCKMVFGRTCQEEWDRHSARLSQILSNPFDIIGMVFSSWAPLFGLLWVKVVWDTSKLFQFLANLGTGTAGLLSKVRLLQVVFSVPALIIGPVLNPWLRQLEYARSSLYHTLYPDVNEATEAFVRGEIDEDTLQTWVEQNDYCPEPWRKVVNSRKDRVEILMALQMWKRGTLTEDEFHVQVRKNGITDEKLRDAYQELQRAIPPITDLLRFMVRDVVDADLVARFKMDGEGGSHFSKKWTGKLKELGEQQGIDEDYARFAWRAHWSLPSRTQLEEFYHRTRHLPPGHALKVELDDVETALAQADVLPFWIPKFINSSFRLMSRVDARRAFETGAMTEEQLRVEFSKLGYESAAIDALTEWAKVNKRGVLTRLPESRLFRGGLISEDQLLDRLNQTKVSTTERQRVVQILRLQRSQPHVNRCVRALRKRFLTGEIDEAVVRSELNAVGVKPGAADELILSFRCEAQAKGKMPSTAQLCTWLEMGAITPTEMRTRLERIGWSFSDALRIVVQCTQRISEKAAKRAEAEAADERRRLEREAREAQKTQREIDRARANAQRQLEKADRIKSRRDKTIQKTIVRFAQQAEIPIEDAGACVHDLLKQLAADTLLTIDERIQSIVLAVEKLKPPTCAELRRLTNLLADQLLETEEITEQFLSTLV